ncbi:MAG: carboxypeptidase-like regulatory domain-containing protein [Acidobacteriaceae bacterium]
MHFCFKSIQGLARTAVALLAILGFAAVLQTTQPAAFAQTAVTGGINGTVMDSTGAVVPNATVTVKDTATNSVRTFTTNSKGLYTVPFLPPDKFTVSATAPGLQSTTTSVQILTGQQSLVNVTVTPSANVQTVQVSANNAQLIDTQSANLTTTFTTAQFQNLPAPGGDITTIAYTLPGVVVNASSGGYGNFSSDGLPGISNLVIINGSDDNDPFLNVNNSGSSNLTIGQQEIAQAAVVQNGYSVQYGRQAGAIETYVTKSGANRVHGLMMWSYNSDGLNANDFFLQHSGPNGTPIPKTKAVSNQYAAQIGGPIKHDKLFFFADTEGIRYILPVADYVNFPTAALQNTILNKLVPGGPNGASAKLYGQMFNTLNGAPSSATAQPVINGTGALQDSTGAMGCGSIAGTPVYGSTTNQYFGTVPAGAPANATAVSCTNAALATGSNLNREWFAAGRLDYNLSDKHKIFVRVTDDQGQQPTFTSVVNPALDAQSNQPAYSGQLNDTYSFTPNVVNQFIMTGMYYSAIFKPVSIPATLAVSPTLLYEANDAGNNSYAGFGQEALTGFPWFSYPQGRNVTQYQFVDDLSWLKGNHNFKFGENFKRDDVTDIGNQINTSGGYYYFGQAADFAGGSLPGGASSNYNQSFTTVLSAHSALYNIGIYAQDEWKAKPNLVIDYGIRVDRNGNPACTTNCFTHFNGTFPPAGVTGNTPYNSTISINHRGAFPAIEAAIIQPRAGFNWDILGNGKSVLRGGVGLFADEFPAFIIANEYGTFPDVFAPAVFSGNVAQGPGSAAAFAAAGNVAVTNGFSKGEGYNQIAAALPTGVPFYQPNYFTTDQTFHSPRYMEWSMQMQQQVTPSDAVILSYAGNHGYDLLMQNNHLNQSLAGTPYTNFGGLPATSPDPEFAQVSKISNDALSGYNGFSLEYKHIDRHGVTADVSYTWSHALDDISNGGTGLYFTTSGVTSQITPYSASKLMYSNSDYDIRNNLVLDVTWVESNHFANKIVDEAAGGWTVASKAYWRSGEPFSVVNTNAENNLTNGTGSDQVLADVVNNNFSHVCNSYSAHCFQTPGIFDGSGSQSNFGNVPRNAFYGPHYADVDLSLYKDVLRMSAAQFQIGAQAYNVLNHPNFAPPGNNASNTGTLGVISGDIGAPTSPYGAFQGSLVSGRVVVVQGRLTF